MIKLGSDVRRFLDEIADAMILGCDVIIEMYGYRSVISAGSSIENINKAVLYKLKTIRMREINLAMLCRFSSMSDAEFRRISMSDPETIADQCLEEGLIPNSYVKTM